jgi:hypothetical protein
MPQAPSDKQLAYLKRLGYSGPAPETSAEASRLIDDLKGGASSAAAAKALTQRRGERARRDLEHARIYVEGLAEMERQYHEACGEPYISGLRLKVPAADRTPENEIYHKAFLPLDVALRSPEILTIDGLEYKEIKRTPGLGLFVVAPGHVVERQKGERAPKAKTESGCAGVVVVALLLGAVVAAF